MQPARHTDGALSRSSATVGDELVVVSNRQPYRHEYEEGGITVDRPTGGLTAGLDGVMSQVGGTWIAWGDGDADGAVVDDAGRVVVPPERHRGQYTLERVWLSDEQVEGYYYGYSNQVLWPICHSALTNVECEPDYWRHYREVNERFADAVCEAASHRAVVWFQDYHLALAPRRVAARLPEETVLAHTWHIPWPSWDVFRSCPHARELLEGLLATDLLTFHVDRYCENFLRCVAAAVPEAHVDWEANRVTFRGDDTAVRAFPMGVAAERIARQASAPQADRFWSTFAAEHGLEDRTVAVGVDRLDYSKGIPQRLAALEHLWATRPQWRGSLSLVQVGSESRSRIPAYRAYQERVEEAVERVNERFGTPDWTPVVYTTEHLDDAELYACYRNADVGVVTPIRDGMNLVAQEYVAAQRDDDAALVLSDQTGAHDELGQWAVTTSPHDVGGIARSIERALTLPPTQRRSRMEALRRHVDEHDLDAWLATVLDAIATLRAPALRDELPAGA